MNEKQVCNFNSCCWNGAKKNEIKIKTVSLPF